MCLRPPPSLPAVLWALQSLSAALLALQVSLGAMLVEDGIIDSNTFLSSWRSLPDTAESAQQQLQATISSVQSATEALQAKNVSLLAHRQVPQTGQDAMYLAGKALGVPVLVELKFVLGQPGVLFSCKSEKQDLAPLMMQLVQELLQ